MSELKVSIELNKNNILKNSTNEHVKGSFQLLTSEKQDKKEQEKINLVFILDRSTSMNDSFYNTGKTKSDAVADAVNSLLSFIQKTDTVSIISFNGDAEVLADHLPKNAEAKLREALDEYRDAYGYTNFEAAMQEAQKLCNRQGENYKLIFLTDGQETDGDSDNALRICREMAERGITTDSMGIGGDFEYNFMKQFTDFSGSMTENLSDLDHAKNVFRNIYNSTTNMYLKQVFINMHFIKELRDVHFYMHLPSQKNYDDYISRVDSGTAVQVSVGNIEQQGFVEFLFDFKLDIPNQDKLQIVTAEITYSCPSQNIDNKTIKDNKEINFSDSASDLVISSDIDNAFTDIYILQHEDDVHKLTSQGNYAEAANKLKTMATLAEEIGDYEKAEGYRKLEKKIIRENHLSQEDLNAISYSSTKSSVKSTFRGGKPNKKRILV
ncbi:MAG: VWA domain-containing protein [Candidatus Cloacimonadales bacterium]|nr:VWA domain-containing protein [Candidatus Cloacimonadales bacterium]